MHTLSVLRRTIHPAAAVRRFHAVASSRLTPWMKITPIPLFSDNYCWLVTDEATNQALLVDPADSDAVLKALPSDGPEIAAVLTTHHHKDHAGGNEGLAAAFPKIPIIAGDTEHKVPAVTKRVADREAFTAANLSVKAIHTPCHTSGHVCYLVTAGADQPAAVFTGDTLFAAGCGRFFEGSAADMHGSLAKLAALPKETLVYCGHEYTVANLKFGLHVEPGNAAIVEKLARCTALREAGKPTVPSTIGEELETNVFLRTCIPAVAAFTHPAGAASAAAGTAAVAAGGAVLPDPVEVLARLRTAKNEFK